mgnify:CR=1 FL=1
MSEFHIERDDASAPLFAPLAQLPFEVVLAAGATLERKAAKSLADLYAAYRLDGAAITEAVAELLLPA